MKGYATIIKADGTTSRTEYDKPIPLKDLQKAVGGYIQIVPMFEKYKSKACIAFINEEGKLDDLPLNVHATLLWETQVGNLQGDYIVGDMIIVQGSIAFMKAL